MATVNPTSADYMEDKFVLELKRVREQIEQKFDKLIDCIKAKEYKLLKEFDTILASYHSYRNEFEKQKVKKQELMETRNFLESKTTNRFLNETILTQINDELASIVSLTEPKMFHFVCDNNRMFAELNKLERLLEKVVIKVDYKSKIYPLVSVCDRGEGIEQLYSPWAVAVDNKTGNIYVADRAYHCVKVFDGLGNFVFTFGDRDGDGKIIEPKCLVISEDRILVSIGTFNSSILIYQLNGNFVTKFGKYGNGDNEFRNPNGLAFNESNGDIYICDYGNNRMQIISKELQFKSQFGAGKLKHPRDVKLSEEYIFILDVSNPCIHLYDYNLILLKSVISRGEGIQVDNLWCFYIDDSNNIIIPYYNSNSIHIYNSQFELIHKISTSEYPVGVVVDNQQRVIVVCEGVRDFLQIF